ncbi:hypothetical protein [Hymenobacter sp. UYCo722]|uniref:hypothetical protein n=1 Tax=Hymenobacter sp. UYCo722 TaxID=3156335 RepID=UPI00339A508C
MPSSTYPTTPFSRTRAITIASAGRRTVADQPAPSDIPATTPWLIAACYPDAPGYVGNNLLANTASGLHAAFLAMLQP